MLVKIVLRTPGDHHKIGETKMDAVPREGEVVTVNDIAYVVHSVTWDLTEMSCIILIRE